LRSRTDLIRLALVAAFVLVIDQTTKLAAREYLTPGVPEEVFGPLALTLSFNDGIAFGLAGGIGFPVVLFSLFALVLLAVFIAGAPPGWLTAISGGLILGGAIGNLIDRVFEGEVTDFIALPWWPTFNFADIGITVGVLLLVVSVIRGGRESDERPTA
jgi:signal peptidase II